MIDHALLSIIDPSQLTPAEECERNDAKQQISILLGETLNRRAISILLARTMDHKTLGELAMEHSVCRERIRQIEAHALRKLRHPWRLARLRSAMESIAQ